MKYVMALSDERKNQIAMLFIKHRVRSGGLPLAQLKRELGNTAKDIGIPIQEAMEFIEPVYREVLEEVFATDRKGHLGFKTPAES